MDTKWAKKAEMLHSPIVTPKRPRFKIVITVQTSILTVRAESKYNKEKLFKALPR